MPDSFDNLHKAVERRDNAEASLIEVLKLLRLLTLPVYELDSQACYKYIGWGMN